MEGQNGDISRGMSERPILWSGLYVVDSPGSRIEDQPHFVWSTILIEQAMARRDRVHGDEVVHAYLQRDEKGGAHPGHLSVTNRVDEAHAVTKLVGNPHEVSRPAVTPDGCSPDPGVPSHANHKPGPGCVKYVNAILMRHQQGFSRGRLLG